MKKIFSFFPIALFALTLQAQTTPTSATAHTAGNAGAAVSRHATQTQASQTSSAVAHAGHSSVQAAEATSLSARLTKSINTRHAKVGQKVFAKTTHKAHLSNGITLPRGTHLLGHVTRVEAHSRSHHAAQLAFTFDRAILRHGRSIPIHAVLTSVSVPSAMASGNAMGGMNAGPMAGGGMAGGSAMAAPAPAPAGGGLVGGGAVGGALHGAGSIAGHSATMAGNNLNAAGRMGAGMTHPMGAAVIGSTTTGEHAMAGLNGTAIPVQHLPGVTLTSSSSSATSATLTSSRRNFALDSGTQMTMNVSAAGSGASAGGAASGSAHGSSHHPSRHN